MFERLSLNFFTNVCELDPEYFALFQTADSFRLCFGDFPDRINVFVHPMPMKRALASYVMNIREFFAPHGGVKIIETDGLADGYKKSIEMAETPYLFQLEHDWLFEKSLISHTLEQMLDAMQESGAEYLRFGKEPNQRNKYGHEFVETSMGSIPACAVKWRSNNPHIINVDAYRRSYFDIINTSEGGSAGVEEFLPEAPGAYVYGHFGYPPTITHSNGRSRLIRFRKSIGKHPYNAIAALGLLVPAFKLWLRASPEAASAPA